MPTTLKKTAGKRWEAARVTIEGPDRVRMAYCVGLDPSGPEFSRLADEVSARLRDAVAMREQNRASARDEIYTLDEVVQNARALRHALDSLNQAVAIRINARVVEDGIPIAPFMRDLDELACAAEAVATAYRKELPKRLRRGARDESDRDMAIAEISSMFRGAWVKRPRRSMRDDEAEFIWIALHAAGLPARGRPGEWGEMRKLIDG
jgi:hypothetical protein